MTSHYRPRRVIKKLRDAFPAEWRGDGGGQAAAGEMVARNQREWEEMWKANFGHLRPLPKIPRLPPGKMAIAIFAGKTDARSHISVTGIGDSGGATTVRWKETPGSGPRCAGHKFQPYLLKFIEKTGNTVAFVREQTPPPASPAPKGPQPA